MSYQIEECAFQSQLNQIWDDCEGALKCAESEDECSEMIRQAELKVQELYNQ